MAKLTNGIKYSNYFFPEIFGEYLLQNGFTCELNESGYLYFKKGNRLLVVMHDNIDVFTNENVSNTASWLFDHQIPEISNCKNIYEFINMMDAHKIQPMDEFVRNASAIDPQLGVEAQFLLNSMAFIQSKNLKQAI